MGAQVGSALMIISSLSLCLLVAFVASSVTARATQTCKTFAEARAAFPGKHLWWHTRAKCWDVNGGAAAGRYTVRPPQPRKSPDSTPMLLFPTLVQGSDGVDPQMLAGSMTEGPLILDIDEVTADRQPPECCWPTIDEDPPASFRERWTAMPVAWVMVKQ
jgi:hypothetical protein